MATSFVEFAAKMDEKIVAIMKNTGMTRGQVETIILTLSQHGINSPLQVAHTLLLESQKECKNGR